MKIDGPNKIGQPRKHFGYLNKIRKKWTIENIEWFAKIQGSIQKKKKKIERFEK